MEIKRLTVDNFKRIKVVDITPEGQVIMITGKNGEGKTSVLDAIWVALANPRNTEMPKPIREGEEKAVITVDLDKYLVRRTFTDAGTRLTVTGVEGAEFKSPQKLIDKLLGSLTFDPLSFITMKDKEQVDILLQLAKADFDFEGNALARKGHYDDRTQANKMVKEIAELMGAEPTKGEKRDIEPLQNKVQATIQAESAYNFNIDKVETITNHIEELKEKLRLLKLDISEYESKKFDSLDTVKKELNEAVEHNNSLGDWDRWNDQNENKIRYADRANELTTYIEDIDKKKKEALENIAFPYPGLSFDEGMVTYNDIPIKQISKAEQIRVSMAVAMAMNPEIRVIRIEDGSLLDSDNLKLIHELAEENNYQVWIEAVDETGEIGVYIEDGTIK